MESLASLISTSTRVINTTCHQGPQGASARVGVEAAAEMREGQIQLQGCVSCPGTLRIRAANPCDTWQQPSTA